jgi:NitT/TauT family transport system ATP-binding protein/nitrate/nitrite transport system substrate-binding protein
MSQASNGQGGEPIRLGFIPLNDCAALAVAREKGFFVAEGLDVTLSREPSWSNIRDKLAVGTLDGAHMLAPMALAASLGLGVYRTPMIAPLALNRNGSAFTVSEALAEAMKSASLAELVGRRAKEGWPPLRFAVVFSYSMHNYELRQWLSDGGIDPDNDVRLVVAPPPRMGGQLESGEIDGFCAGEPWNALAVARGTGTVAVRAIDIWPNGPDKVLGVTRSWAEAEPVQLLALVRALVAAAAWADAPENRDELASLLAQPAYVGAPKAVIAASLADIVFSRDGAGVPRLEHAEWFLEQMLRWGQIDSKIDRAATAAEVYRPDLFEAATG